jgi:hypothetical protein
LGRLLRCRFATSVGSPRPKSFALGREPISGLRLNALPQLLGFAVSPAPDAGPAGASQRYLDAGWTDEIKPGSTQRGTLRATTQPELVACTRRIQHANSYCHQFGDDNRSGRYHMQRGDDDDFVADSAAGGPNVVTQRIDMDL